MNVLSAATAAVRLVRVNCRSAAGVLGVQKAALYLPGAVTQQGAGLHAIPLAGAVTAWTAAYLFVDASEQWTENIACKN